MNRENKGTWEIRFAELPIGLEIGDQLQVSRAYTEERLLLAVESIDRNNERVVLRPANELLGRPVST